MLKGHAGSSKHAQAVGLGARCLHDKDKFGVSLATTGIRVLRQAGQCRAGLCSGDWWVLHWPGKDGGGRSRASAPAETPGGSQRAAGSAGAPARAGQSQGQTAGWPPTTAPAAGRSAGSRLRGGSADSSAVMLSCRGADAPMCTDQPLKQGIVWHPGTAAGAGCTA